MTKQLHALYKGVSGYGRVTRDEILREGFSGFLFEASAGTLALAVSTADNYALQNRLEVGKTYILTIEDGKVIALDSEKQSCTHTPRISGQRGVRTIRNLLKTAFEPMGTTLYVYGGGWNWQDNGSAPQATSYGIAQQWIDFYKAHAGHYNMKYVWGTGNTVEDHEHGYYPYEGWNQYYYAGLDCSGFIGWLCYNTLTADGQGAGYVGSASAFAKRMAEQHHFGAFTQTPEAFRTGDIVSIPGHVWMVIGTCADGSTLLIHSSATPDTKGETSGGVQLSAINPKDTGKNCDAYRLAQRYTEKYYPEWFRLYGVILKDYAVYTDYSKNAGVFTWNTDGTGLDDPDGYQRMTPEEILRDLFEE